MRNYWIFLSIYVLEVVLEKFQQIMSIISIKPTAARKAHQGLRRNFESVRRNIVSNIQVPFLTRRCRCGNVNTDRQYKPESHTTLVKKLKEQSRPEPDNGKKYSPLPAVWNK